MSYKGRYQIGTHVPLHVLTVNGANTPIFPTNAPVIEVWSETEKVFGNKAIPVMDRFGQTGLFAWRMFLDGRFAPGRYTVYYRYTVGTFQGLVEDTFEIVAGGDANGAAIALTYYERPHAVFCVFQLDSGRLQKGRNPTV